jgi:hypothetical protein
MSRKGIKNLPTRGKRICITLQQSDIETLLKIGKGNASKGVREMISSFLYKLNKKS